MNAHHFIEGVKVQRFCLTLLGQARLWYHSLEPISVNMQGLENLFRQQYSKIGYTREQLSHAWESFSFDENTVIVDAYVTHIRQVVTFLGYGEQQSLEVFKNTLPTKLYWILFPIDDLRLDFGHTPDKMKKEYLDVYEGIQSEILSTARFDEDSDLSTTYLGKEDKSKNNKIKAEQSFPVSEQGCAMPQLLPIAQSTIYLPH